MELYSTVSLIMYKLRAIKCFRANSQNDQSEKYEIDGEEKREIIEFSDEEEIMIDNNEEEINYWRECIWKQLKTIPNPFK